MNAADIIAYGFDGALYCPLHVPQAGAPGSGCEDAAHADENGACEENCHGYGPNPVFGGDEGLEGDSCDVEGCGPIDE